MNLVLADTSFWVHFFRGKKVDSSMLERLATCSPVIQEVLQGVHDPQYYAQTKNGILALPRLLDPIPAQTYIAAADIYRQGRLKGYTIRSSIDCLIAAIAIETETPILHFDRDFDMIAKYTSLQLF